MDANYFWSLLTQFDFMFDVWIVIFANGYAYDDAKPNPYQVVCVR